MTETAIGKHAAGAVTPIEPAETKDAQTGPHPEATTLSQQDVEKIKAAWSAQQPKVDGYTPVFGDTTRTVIYLVCWILGILAFVATVASAVSGAPTWLTAASAILSWIAPQTANTFGVAYNPLRLAGK